MKKAIPSHLKGASFSEIGNLLSNPVWKERLFLAVPAAIFLVCYAKVLNILVQTWMTRDDFSHGFLVVPISLYLVWIGREKFIGLKPRTNLAGGMAFLLIAFAMALSGNAGSFLLFEELSLIVMIAGLVLLLLGTSYFKLLALPIGYLIFMVPVLDDVIDSVQWPFQLLAANIGVSVLQLLGFPVFQEALIIRLPHTTLEVAEACSGIKFLTSTVAIGIPLAWLTLTTWPRRISLILFGIVVAVLANGLRVALVGGWAYYHPEAEIHGPMHIFQGVFVAWIGFIALFAGAWVLSRNQKKRVIPEKTISEAAPGGSEKEEKQERVRFLSWIVANILLLALGSFYYFHHISPIPLAKDFSGFPMVIGDWKGEDLNFKKDEPFRIERADHEMVRKYQDKSGRSVRLYVGYYASQDHSKKLVGSFTKAFHRGAVEIALPSGPEGAYPVNRVTFQKKGENGIGFFWYDLNGRVVANRIHAKFWT
ncbi:MAG TPA: exosortase W, partial [Nitrospiria bacterium]|nr:exosortase W [Nitrospiria bacterium]